MLMAYYTLRGKYLNDASKVVPSIYTARKEDVRVPTRNVYHKRRGFRVLALERISEIPFFCFLF